MIKVFGSFRNILDLLGIMYTLLVVSRRFFFGGGLPNANIEEDEKASKSGGRTEDMVGFGGVLEDKRARERCKCAQVGRRKGRKG